MFVIATIAPFHVEHLVPWVLSYVGPDVFLPLTSALAAIAGVLLMFWNRVVGVIRRIFRGSRQAPPSTPKSDMERN
jgi:hypothetical protein